MCDSVRFRVLEKDVERLDGSVREAERCCGMLKGDASRLSERVVVLEHDVNSKCAGMVGDVDGLKVDVAEVGVLVESLQGEVRVLRSRLWWAITVALGAVMLDLIHLV